MHVCINQGITATSMNLMLYAQHSFCLNRHVHGISLFMIVCVKKTLQRADTYLIQIEYRLCAAVRLKQAQRNLPLRHAEWSALRKRTFNARW